MAAKKTTDFKVTKRLQVAFLVVVTLAWLSNFWYLIFWNSGYISVGTWVFQITQIGLPLLWLGAALWFVWSNYTSRLHRLFAAAFLAFIGYGSFMTLSSIEQSLRFKFYPPVISGPNDNSLLTAFGHEWLVQSAGIVLFVLIVVFFKYRSKKV